jgi:hypothetical protein
MNCKKLYGTDVVLWGLNFSMFLLESIPVLESIRGKALDYLNRPGWKWLTVANTLAYWNTELITTTKGYMAHPMFYAV